MPVHFNHTIIPAVDKHVSARFLTGILGLPDAQPGGFFLTVTLDDGVTLQYAEPGITYWADPRGQRIGEYNTNHGGRGLQTVRQ